MSHWAERHVPALAAELVEKLPGGIPRWKVAYWQFQSELTRLYILPFLREHGALPASGRILEVGAGEGGCLAAIQEAAGLPGEGLELSADRVALARELNTVLAAGGLSFHTGDITDADCAATLAPPYALILARDVLEHIEAREAALQNCHKLLAPDGHILFTFPPYYSPYGGHQQLLSRNWLRVPWLQLLPFFPELVRRGETVAGKRREIEGIRRSALTLGGLERMATRLGFHVAARRCFLIRPALRYRYGLPVVGAPILSVIPGLRELLVTGAWYLLRRTAEGAHSQVPTFADD